MIRELRGYGDFARVENDMTEPHWLPSTPYRSNTWERVASYRPPKLGEDTIELMDELGFSGDEISALQGAQCRLLADRRRGHDRPCIRQHRRARFTGGCATSEAPTVPSSRRT